MLKRSANGHLHLALLVALATASVIALAVPISRTRASEQASLPNSPSVAGAAAAGEGVESAVSSDATERIDSAPQYIQGTMSIVSPELILQPPVRAGALGASGGAFTAGESRAALGTRTVSFTVHEDGFASRQVSSQLTVGQAMAEVGIKLSGRDAVTPAADSPLTPGLHVYISHAGSVRLIVEGAGRLVYTHADTVAGLLAEAGVPVEPGDRVFPALDQPVSPGMSVSVTTMRGQSEVTDDLIPFETVYREDASYLQGQRILIEPGEDGHLLREYQVQRLNGREVSRTLLSESMVPPTEQVVALGTGVPATPAPPPPVRMATIPEDGGGLNCARTLSVNATWYTAASAGGRGITATGTPVYKGIVAVDPAVIPLGTKMYIPGYGYGVAADTGGGIRGNIIDLGYGADDVYDWRTRWVDICILA